MGVVAPGNKQIGSYSITSISQVSSSELKISATVGIAVTKFTQTTAVPTKPSNSGIGAFSITSVGGTSGTVKFSSAVLLALVKYVPPVSITARAAVGLSLVKSSTNTSTSTKPKNTGIGSFNLAPLLNSKQTVNVSAMVGIAVVQYHTVRDELIPFNTNF